MWYHTCCCGGLIGSVVQGHGGTMGGGQALEGAASDALGGGRARNRWRLPGQGQRGRCAGQVSQHAARLPLVLLDCVLHSMQYITPLA